MSGILQTLFYNTVTTVKDAYFNLVTLLLPGNGTNGAQNNTFLDSSSNNFTITRNGNTTQGTFTPFSQTGWGNYFNGSTDYLSVANATALQLSNEFTVEAWYYPISFPGAGSYHCLVINGNNQSSSNALGVFIKTSGGIQIYNFAANSAIFDTASGVVLNSWNHIAVTRNSSNSVNLWLNGVSQGAAVTVSNSFSSTSATLIGASNIIGTGISQYANGYISNLRITKGGALYTSNFTPSTTPLTTTVSAGTVSLLTCQSNRFVDNSSNAFALTVSGTPSVQAFSPFAPTAAYSTTTVGGSGYFDGTGDYLSVASATALNISTGAFTIEGFVYLSATSYVVSRRASAAARGFALYFDNSTQKFNFLAGDTNISGWEVTITSTNAYALYQWVHVAVTRDASNVFTLWVNGTSQGTVTSAVTIADDTSNLLIGGIDNTGSYTGYLSSFRILKGTALYTATFTPPTAPLTNITNTSLLLNYTNAGITDATAKNDLETVGNAQISTTQSKFGGSSMYFDGTGDWLSTIKKPVTDLGSGDFTVEVWVNPSSNSVSSFVSQSAVNSNGWALGYVGVGQTTGKLWWYSNSGAVIVSSSTLPTGAWAHIAVVRSGTTLTMYINGTSVGSATNSTNYSGTSVIYVGSDEFSQSYTGYIDDLRITKGVARYTANFTAPTSAFPLQ